jgi:hypothetical protein
LTNRHQRALPHPLITQSQISTNNLSPACFEIHSPDLHIKNAEDYITIDEVKTSESEDDPEEKPVEKDDDSFAPKSPVEEDNIFELELD